MKTFLKSAKWITFEVTILLLLANCGRDSVPASYAVLSDPISVSMGDLHTCAVFATGLAQCWGYNRAGQLGNLSHNDSLVPVNVTAYSGTATAITALGGTTCAIVDGGEKCWGGSAKGDGTSTNSDSAVQVLGLTSGVTAITNGQSSACAIVNGGAKCWGSNSNGQLGDGTTTNSTSPVNVSDLPSGVDKISSGGSNHTCALVSGAVKCWGKGLHGELGNNSGFNSTTPASVASLTSGVANVSVGRQHSCALLTNGSVKCWGRNAFGQLGNDTLEDSLTPVTVTGMDSGVTQLASGGHHVCAIKDSELYCWGNNGDGQLGDSTNTNRATPTLVPDFAGLTLVTAGRAGTCAVKLGKLYCWGSNVFGQLGDGTTLNRAVPTGVYAESFSANPLLPFKRFLHWVAIAWGSFLKWVKF